MKRRLVKPARIKRKLSLEKKRLKGHLIRVVVLDRDPVQAQGKTNKQRDQQYFVSSQKELF